MKEYTAPLSSALQLDRFINDVCDPWRCIILKAIPGLTTADEKIAKEWHSVLEDRFASVTATV